MGHPVEEAFRESLTRTLPELHLLTESYQEPWLVWERRGPGSWNGSHILRPALGSILMAAKEQITAEAARLRSIIESYYPAFMGKIGLRYSGIGIRSKDLTFPLSSALLTVWNIQQSFVPDSAVINEVAASALSVLENARVKIRFSAPVVNLRSEIDSLRLSPDLTLRRMSEKELTDYYGGSHSQLLFFGRPSKFGLDEFILEGEIEGSLIFRTEDLEQGTSTKERVSSLLDRAILAIRAFRQGPVGYNYVQYRPIGFFPTFFSDSPLINVHIPLGHYKISSDDTEKFAAFAKLVMDNKDSALDMGCRRLSDAQVRTRPEDQIVDAVVGMEAILLAGLANDDRRGELKFRFSMNYAVLDPDPEERYRRFKLAKDLYNLRSTVAHGSALKETVRVGEEKLTAQRAAVSACDALRDVLYRLLPEAGESPHRRSEFWDRAYFGLG